MFGWTLSIVVVDSDDLTFGITSCVRWRVGILEVVQGLPEFKPGIVIVSLVDVSFITRPILKRNKNITMFICRVYKSPLFLIFRAAPMTTTFLTLGDGNVTDIVLEKIHQLGIGLRPLQIKPVRPVRAQQAQHIFACVLPNT